MATSWSELTGLIDGEPLIIERIRLPRRGITLEGEFEMPTLAALGYEDQVFVAAFVRSHGSIKAMERMFGVSYPTIKARLNRITQAMGLPEVEIEPVAEPLEANVQRQTILRRLETGEIDAEQAIRELREG